MQAEVCDNCFVICPRTDRDYRRVGLYSRDKRALSDSLFFRAAAPAPPANGRATENDFTSIAKRLNGEFLFGGIIFAHFGHLLVETFSRLWAFFESDLPILFIDAPHSNNQLFWRLVDTMNFPRNRIVLVSESATVSKLHVTPPGFSIRRAIDLNNVRYFERVSSMLGGEENTDPRPVYLSRSKIGRDRRYHFGEIVLEKLIASRGVDIVHPQELTLTNQILLLKSRKNVFGFTGSAFHTLLFCKAKKNVVYLGTRPPNENYRLVESIKCNNANFVVLPEIDYLRKIFSRVPFLRARISERPFLLNQEAVLAACRSMGVDVEPRHIDTDLLRSESEAFVDWVMKFTSRRLYEKLVNGEISVSRAEAVLKIVSEGLKSAVLLELPGERLAALA
jgi:hypothetical protein